MKKENQQKYGFVYRWYDFKKKMYYIGSHFGSEDDGYICSSNWMRNSYNRRKEDFEREILITNIETRIETLEIEYKWLQLIPDKELGKGYYNLSKKHFNHWSLNEEKRLSISERLSVISKKRFEDPEYRKHHSEIRIGNVCGRGNKGKHHSEEAKKAISDKLKNKVFSEKTKKLLSEKAKSRDNSVYIGRTQSEETRQKITEGLIKYHANKKSNL